MAEFRNNTPGFGWKELTPDLSLLLARIMTRGLLLFNLVFLVQNLLDVDISGLVPHCRRG